MINEFTRECLAIDVDRSIDTGGVVLCLERGRQCGAPAYVRFGHGPEFIAYAVADWCRFNGPDTVGPQYNSTVSGIPTAKNPPSWPSCATHS